MKSDLYEILINGTELNIWNIGLSLLGALLVGVYIYFVYKLFTKSAFYSKDLNVTLAGIVVVTAVIMIAMQSNLLVSMGMVGALSIVRFRTAIKNPLDLLYLFWGITAGVVCGVGLYMLAVIMCAVMTVTIFALTRVPVSKAPALAVVWLEETSGTEQVYQVLRGNSRQVKENSVIVKNEEKEVIYELIAPATDEISRQLTELPDVRSFHLLQHTGEMRV